MSSASGTVYVWAGLSDPACGHAPSTVDGAARARRLRAGLLPHSLGGCRPGNLAISFSFIREGGISLRHLLDGVDPLADDAPKAWRNKLPVLGAHTLLVRAC